MNTNRQSAEEEAQSRQVTRTVKSFSEGVYLLVTMMVEDAHKDAEHGDKSAQAFVKDWQAFFADRRHN